MAFAAPKLLESSGVWEVLMKQEIGLSILFALNRMLAPATVALPGMPLAPSTVAAP
jgi:hypothetical protein